MSLVNTLDITDDVLSKNVATKEIEITSNIQKKLNAIIPEKKICFSYYLL